MYTKQVSIFLENKKGRLAEVTKLLKDEGINIRALSLADMPDLGILRLIVSDRLQCLRLLKEHGFAARETDVIACEIRDEPGGLYKIIEILDREGINIEYIYTFFRKNVATAVAVFRFDEPARALETLKSNGIPILPEDAIQNL
jgi:hypothetical protein